MRLVAISSAVDCLLAGFFCVLLIISRAVAAQENPAGENVDHRGIISRWNGDTLSRGQKLFVIACAPCHGTNGVQTINPQSRPFALDRFQNGSDPFRMFKTITAGFKNMPSQTWMTPEQRYDVIHYIRETFLKKLNPGQYTIVDDAYLDSLPNYTALVSSSSQAQKQNRDFGPVLESQLGTEHRDALTFRLKDDITVSYDLHRMKMAGAWKGGFLDLSRTGHFQQRGEGQPRIQGDLIPGLQQWRWAHDGSFDYSEQDLLPRGPLPETWMKYHGHYVHNRQAILSFTIDGRKILEWPEAERTNGLISISHTLKIFPGSATLRICLGQDTTGRQFHGVMQHTGSRANPVNCTATESMVVIADNAPSASDDASQNCGNFMAAGISGQTEGLKWEIDRKSRAVLNIPAGTTSRVVRIVCSSGTGGSAFQSFKQQIRHPAEVSNPEELTLGGARLWPLPIEVNGTCGGENGAYALDTIPVPFDNPYGAWLRTSALAFFPDGRAVVTTYCGDVWVISGLDRDLKHVTWSRFASGLYEPFGAQVIHNTVYVTCRNGIVRLHDFNQDGEADFYETFYADPDVSTFFHAFNFDLQVDPRGHLYYVKPGEYTDYKLPGAVLEVMPDGSSSSVYCTGYRVPNGMGILPDGRLTVSDNQGNWMPASKINLVRRGGFYGYAQTLKGGGGFGDQWAPDGGKIDADKVQAPKTFDQPIIWMPQEFDNSSGGQLWVDDSRFGPLAGRLLHTSFGKGWLYYLMIQEVGSVSQAAIVALPFQFDAGIMRARVNPADGQVYATGLSGWQGPAKGKDGCLQRLRFTRKPSKLLDDVKVRPNGLALRFNFDLDQASALDAANYQIEQWNYRWASQYGSEQYSVEHPEQKGHDRLAISGVKLNENKREVFLEIPRLRPVNQVELRLTLKASDAVPFKELAYLTINAVPER